MMDPWPTSASITVSEADGKFELARFITSPDDTGKDSVAVVRREGNDIIMRTSTSANDGVEARLSIELVGGLIGMLVSVAIDERAIIPSKGTEEATP